MATQPAQTKTDGKQPGPRRKPPKLLMKVMNPLMKRRLNGTNPGKMADVLLLLTFTGRKSGKQFTTPVGYHLDGDDVMLFTHSPWWKNMEGGTTVTLRLQGRTQSGFAQATANQDEVIDYVRRFVAQYGVKDAGRLAITFGDVTNPTDEDFRLATRGLRMIRIKLDATGPQ